MNGIIVIVGDFNIDWLNTNGCERKRFYNTLETFRFVQNICTETHRSHHLLNYIITRKDCNIISDCTVSDFISDHRVIIIIIIIYSSIALISSSVRTCSVRCLENYMCLRTYN